MLKARGCWPELPAQSRWHIREELFQQIVMLDEPRILSRLRSKHAARTRKTVGKPELLTLLNRTINDPSINICGNEARAKMIRAQSQSERLAETFKQFETARDSDAASSLSQDMLIDVLLQIYGFDVSSLQAALQTSSSIDPSLMVYLPQALGKLRRYYCIACDLIDAARSSKYTLFGRISIRALKQPQLNTAALSHDLAGFDQVLHRITGSTHRQLRRGYPEGLVSTARRKFQSRMSNCATPWKIHAEVQLVLFYEQSPQIPHPRVISSSKSACYLCDLFIKIHGKFKIPRAHGRLYDRWILPEWPMVESCSSEHLISVIGRFNSTLEGKILHTLSHKRLACRHPNESVLLLREPWSSTSTLSKASTRHSSTDAIEYAREGVLDDHCQSPSKISTVVDGESSDTNSDGNAPSLPPPVPSAMRGLQDVQQRTEEVSECVSPARPTVARQRLSRGDSTYHKFTSSRDTFTVQTDFVIVHASWDCEVIEAVDCLSGRRRACWIQVKWLACDDQNALGDGRVESLGIDVLKNCQERIVEGGGAFSSKDFILEKGSHKMHIRYTFEEPDTRSDPFGSHR